MYNMDAADRLIESTRELLWERGYVGTSPKAIQQRAGAGQGSMYHHFSGKPDLARQAIARSADVMRAAADAALSGPGTPVERITAYLRRERDVLRGCPIGRLAADPDVLADPALRAPLTETFAWLRGRLTALLTEAGRQAPGRTAATVVATLQGGYVLARAAGEPTPFADAVEGLIALLED